MKSKFLVCLTIVILGISCAGIADAHTTSIGFVPGLNAGEVTFWTGSYHSSGINEGTLTLTGVSVVFNQTKPFDITPVTTKPTGLVDGSNNFFWAANGTFPHSVDPILFGGVELWQGVTFGGLSAGDYTFSCGATCGTSAVWHSFGQTGNLPLTLKSGDIGGGGNNAIPEPASMFLLGSGLIGAFVRRKLS